MTIIKVCINDPMMTSLCRVQTTRCLGPIVDDRLAANCLIFSDVKEMRDGFSQRLIIPMNSVTISIWPEALDRNRRRSCGGKVDRLGRKENWSGLQMSRHAYHGIPCHGIPLHSGWRTLHTIRRKRLHKRTEREKPGLGPRAP